MLKPLRDKVKKYFSELISIHESPHSIAFGFATGTFIAILPTPGLNFALAFLIIFLYPKINKLSLLGAIVFWNPITLAPIYFGSYWLGRLIFSDLPIVHVKLTLVDKVYYFTRRFLVGNFILAVTVTLAVYLLIFWIATSYQSKYVCVIKKEDGKLEKISEPKFLEKKAARNIH